MKVLQWGRKSEMEILCFLLVLEGADSEKVVFEHWSVCHSVRLSFCLSVILSVCHSVCLSETTLQLEPKELRA